MKENYQIFPPCYINGIWVESQDILRNHYRKQATARALGMQNPFGAIQASARSIQGCTQAELVIEHIKYMEQKREREGRELSTEWGHLRKNDPAELQRIMKEDPKRYDEMSTIHTLTMVGK